MSKWTHLGDNAARLKDALIDGKESEAFLMDCDGDFVSWNVITDGIVIDHGYVRPEEVSKDPTHIQSEIDAWNEAKRRSEWVFCYQKPLVDRTGN